MRRPRNHWVRPAIEAGLTRNHQPERGCFDLNGAYSLRREPRLPNITRPPLMPIRSLRALQSVTARAALLLNAQIGEPPRVEPLFHHPLAPARRGISFVPILGACAGPPDAVRSVG